MNCWHCDRPAHAVCYFCGRAACKEHVQTMPGLIDLFRDGAGTLRGVVTANVVWCGVCEPQEHPVDLDDVDVHPLPADAEREVEPEVEPEAEVQPEVEPPPVTPEVEPPPSPSSSSPPPPPDAAPSSPIADA